MKEKIKLFFSKMISKITGVFVPIIPVLMGTAILKGILMLLVSWKLSDETNGLYQVLYAVSDAFLYYMPVFLAYTASKQFKADSFIAMVIALGLLHPNMIGLMSAEGTISILGMPVMKMSYTSSVIPILLAVLLLHYIEKFLDRYLPEVIRGFMKPILAIVIVLPLTLLVFGPIGSMIGTALADIFFFLYEINQVVAGAVLGFLIQPMVVLGCHWSIVPVCIANIAANGSDPILPLLGAAVMGQAGAAFAVGLIQRDKKKKSIAFSASVISLFGTTEPALFGVNVPLMRPMISGCVAGAVGGGMVGLSNARACSFAFPSFTTLVVYMGDGFLMFVMSMVVGFIIGFILTMLQKKQIMKKIKELNM